MRPSKPTPATPLSVASQISQLPELTMADIKSLWQRLFHAANPTHNRQFLERRIAYKLQEIEFRKVNPALLDRNKRRIENLIDTGKVKTRDPDYRPVAWHHAHPRVPGQGISRHRQRRWQLQLRWSDIPKPVPDCAGDYRHAVVWAGIFWSQSAY